mmetsp:Transcript_101282/g.281910  ORF Transcript_101282/g.281910 Transcript_101282/m.281910 type:complete len:583 (-) Transcript_101282:154-1902(-)
MCDAVSCPKCEIPATADSLASQQEFCEPAAPCACEVFYLFSSPLPLPPLESLRPLDFKSDVLQISEAFQDAQRITHPALPPISVGVATADSLTRTLTLATGSMGLVLHISAHSVWLPAAEQQPQRIGLVLEDSMHKPHVVPRDKLEELLGGRNGRGLQNISLLFLSSCWSEELAQVFIECGCRHVIAVRTPVLDTVAQKFSTKFYLELAMEEPLLSAFEKARDSLLMESDPAVQRQAKNFVFFGQRGADAVKLSSGYHGSVKIGMTPVTLFAPTSRQMRDFETAEVFLTCTPHAEGILGRAPELCSALHEFVRPRGSRVAIVHGPSGVGKSALGIKLAEFASAPGRPFSCGALGPIRIRSSSVEDLASQIEEEIRGRAENHLRDPSSASLPVPCDSFCSASPSDVSSAASPSSASRVCRGLREMQRFRPRSRLVLIVLDDELGVASGRKDFREFLSEVMERIDFLRLLICSREPVYGQFGSLRTRNILLQGLPPMDAVRLFLLRVHRRLSPVDLSSGGMYSALPEEDAPGPFEEQCARVCRQGCLQQLQGHPGKICALSAQVVPDGASLHELNVETLAEPCT